MKDKLVPVLAIREAPENKDLYPAITLDDATTRQLYESIREHGLLEPLTPGPSSSRCSYGPPRLTKPQLSSQTTFQLNWGLLLCLACCSLIGFLLIPPADPMAPQISTTHLEVPAPGLSTLITTIRPWVRFIKFASRVWAGP